jgi:hydroxymethylbilane synthase
VCVPAPGQGIVAVEIRASDEHARRALAGSGDPETAVSLTAERAVVSALGGGCQLPLGAIAQHEGTQLRMHGVVASLDGVRVVRREVSGPADDPAGLGLRLAEALAQGGATEILGALSDDTQP